MYAIERAILSTYIKYDLQINDDFSSRIRSYELVEKTFTDPYFKVIVNTINNLRRHNKPYFTEALAEELQTKGVYHNERYMDILDANIITPNSFKEYYEHHIKESKTLSSGRV